MKKDNLLIVGAGGSIGNALASSLCDTYDIIGITSNEITNSKIFLKIYNNVDIRNTSQYMNICKDIEYNFKTLKGIIYASGITLPNDIQNMSEEDWDNTMSINLKGYWLTLKYLYNVIISSATSIIQINSKTGKKGSFKNSAYSASKFGGIGLTQAMALELAETGARVNAVCPGNVFDSNTWKDPNKGLFVQYARTQNSTPEKIKEKYLNLVPMKRCCTYDDIINVVEFLLSDKSSYMTGQSINITGGQQLY